MSNELIVIIYSFLLVLWSNKFFYKKITCFHNIHLLPKIYLLNKSSLNYGLLLMRKYLSYYPNDQNEIKNIYYLQRGHCLLLQHK